MKIMKQLLMVLIGCAGCTSLDGAQASIHDFAHTILFSERAQRLADICLFPRARFEEREIAALSSIPLLAFCADIAKSRLTDRGIKFGFSAPAFGAACIASLTMIVRGHYFQHALHLLQKKIRNKQPLSAYEVEKTLDVSRRILAVSAANFNCFECGFFDNALFEHPQIGKHPVFIKAFLNQCLKGRNHHVKTLISATGATELLEQHPEFVESYVKKCLHENTADASHFTDLAFTTYIEHYMQEDENERLMHILIATELPQATEALLKRYPPSIADACTLVTQKINQLSSYYHATPMLDYICSLFIQHTTDTMLHRRLLTDIMDRNRIHMFPRTLHACNNSTEHITMIEELLRKCPNSIKEIRDIDTMISAVPSLTPLLKDHCLAQCPSMAYTQVVTNKQFFVDILLDHFNQGTSINISTEKAAMLNCPRLAKLTHKQLKSLVPTHCAKLRGPTKKYIDTHPQRVIEKFQDDMQNKSLQQLSKDIITLEDQETKKGHYTFVHGEPKQMHALQYWFTKLYEIKHQVSLNDYLFTRFSHGSDRLSQLFQWGKRIVSTTAGSRSDIFMGHCLYSNWSCACAGDYYLKNRGIFGYHNSLHNIFKAFGYAATYDRYKKELKLLEKAYANLCPHGQVLLFSFSEDALKKSVYVSASGCAKRSVTIKNGNAPIETSDIVTIARALHDDIDSVEEYEGLEFCFTPTTDYGLHRDIAGKEVRIFNLTGADPEKMKAYQAKEQALFERIQADIKAQVTQTSRCKDKNSNTIVTAQA